jgi:hypothetical protein
MSPAVIPPSGSRVGCDDGYDELPRVGMPTADRGSPSVDQVHGSPFASQPCDPGQSTWAMPVLERSLSWRRGSRDGCAGCPNL